MIRLHMVDYKIIYRSIPYRLIDIVKEIILKSTFNCIDQCDLFVSNDIGIVAHTIWQRPKPFEEHLIIIIYSNRIYSITNLLHNNQFLARKYNKKKAG